MPNDPANTDTLPGPAILYETDQGVALDASILRIARHHIAFQVHTPGVTPRLSQVWENFRIVLSGKQVYEGRATLQSIVDAGAGWICEAKLEDAWLDFLPPGRNGAQPRKSFGDYIRESQLFRIRPEFKLVIADMQALLHDLRHWTEQLELFIPAETAQREHALEKELLQGACQEALPCLAAAFERFEILAHDLDPREVPAHAAYAKRQLHPLVLCAPFMYRTFKKPLGYAGDYEMVNMMVRDPLEGATAFAKVLNAFFLNTPPVVAHRNRIMRLKGMLVEELLRCAGGGSRVRLLDIGCGPACEIAEIVKTSPLSSSADITLLDFNQETLDYAGAQLTALIKQNHRSTRVRLLRRSVTQLLKDAAKINLGLAREQYEVVYCAGLFDYMPDAVCREILSLAYKMLAPGGLLLATNVDACNPSRGWMELVVDWHLIYRTAKEFRKLVPAIADPESCRIYSEESAVNVFLEIRKPRNV